MGVGMIKELIIENFRGFKEYMIEFDKGLNVIHGGNCKGKSSIIDSILFLQMYSYYAGNPHEHHPVITDPSVLVRAGEKEFCVALKLYHEGVGDVYYRIDVDTEGIMYTESFIIDDTVYTYSGGVLRIKDARRSRYTPKTHEIPGETLWDRINKWKIKVAGLPWRNTSHLVSVETSHWGGIVEAAENVPEILSRIISARLIISGREVAENLRLRLRRFFKTVFLTHYFLRRMVVLKNIDYKNAIGPSKHLTLIMDPYASNFPWILLNAIRMGHGPSIRKDMEELGYKGREFSVASTIDNRYYLLMTVNGRAVYTTRLPLSLVKTLVYVTAARFSNGHLLIDDFDDHLDEDSSIKLLNVLKQNTNQLIVATRRKYIAERAVGRIIDLS